MTRIGRIVALWRYPVKGMRGEPLTAAALDAFGLVGDRRYAFTSSAAPVGAPLLASRERTAMLRYSATFPTPDAPPNVTTPNGEIFPVDSPALLMLLQAQLAQPGATLTLRHAAKPITDVRPVALHSSATIEALSRELAEPLDPQRFRSDIVLELDGGEPFAEDALAGHILRLGPTAELRLRERIPRCRIVLLDPATAATHATLLRHLARHHEGRLGIYAQVQTPGVIAVGDPIYIGALRP